jgi:predicted HAD superfamily hydrolase
MSRYKQAISVTIDEECVVWLNSKKEKRSKVVNKLIQAAMLENKTYVKDLQEQLAQAKKAIQAYIALGELKE